jgi:hypothetical protein
MIDPRVTFAFIRRRAAAHAGPPDHMNTVTAALSSLESSILDRPQCTLSAPQRVSKKVRLRTKELYF